MRAASLVAVAVVGALVGCGSGTTFTAEELIAEVNEHGAGLALGEPLATGDEGVEVYSLTFLAGEGPATDVHAGGSLLIAEDDDGAMVEYRRCDQTASLVCFRAANAVLVFDDDVPHLDLTRIREAIRAMGSP